MHKESTPKENIQNNELDFGYFQTTPVII